MNKDLCPCCRGTRGRWEHGPVWDAYETGWDHVDAETCVCGPRFVPCLACRGTGELTGIARATLLARGDIAPVQKRGFA